MGTNFRNDYPVEGKDLQVDMKIYLNNAWWRIIALEEESNGAKRAHIQAPFRGSAKVELDLSLTYYVDVPYYTLGHKHSHILTNDSSKQKKRFKYPYTVVNTGYGMGGGH